MNGIKALSKLTPLALECVSAGFGYEADYLYFAGKQGIEPLSKAKYEQVERIFDKEVERYCSMQAKQYSCPSIDAEERYYEQE